MAPRLLEWLFRKFGRRYPRLVLWAQFQAAHLVVAGGLGLFALYQPMSVGEFAILLAIGEGLMFLENVLSFRLSSRMLRPVDGWLRGDRSREATITAWQALAELPVKYLRRWLIWPLVLQVIPFSASATALLGLRWYSFFFIAVGGLVAVLYGGTLRFFLMELALRPVLEAVGRQLPEDAQLGRAGISLRWRLLAVLPAMNVISGVIVAGLSGTAEDATLADLGLDIAAAVVVAFTISLELTILLSRSILQPIGRLTRAAQDVARGDYSVRVPVVSTDETGRLALAFNSALKGLEERERLREAFGAFVDPTVAERVLEEGTNFEGEEVEVSVLFLDIRGFTSFAERSSAREVVRVLNDFYSRVVPVIVEHGGHANKFVGDGLLGVFGAPERLPDHADRAVAAALAIGRLVRAEYGEELRIGIGVNSGPVVSGTIGGGGHVEFTVIGDAVNTAARVEEATRVSGDEILVTQATRALLTRDFGAFERRPPVPLKGKTEPVALFVPAESARIHPPEEPSAASSAVPLG